jgi:hypothetical protein
MTRENLNDVVTQFSDCHHGICEVIERLQELACQGEARANPVGVSDLDGMADKLESVREEIDAAVESMKEHYGGIQADLADIMRRLQ